MLWKKLQKKHCGRTAEELQKIEEIAVLGMCPLMMEGIEKNFKKKLQFCDIGVYVLSCFSHFFQQKRSKTWFCSFRHTLILEI